MKPIHILAALAVLAGCTAPVEFPFAGSGPAAVSSRTGDLVDLPVELKIRSGAAESYSLQATPVATDVVASVAVSSNSAQVLTNVASQVRAITIQVISNGVSQTGVQMVPAPASAALFPYAAAGATSTYSRWEIFTFPSGISSTNPPTATIRGLKKGVVHRAIVRAYGAGVVPATVYDPTANPTATSPLLLSDIAESTTELDLTGSVLPTKAKLTLSLLPVTATLGIWFPDPDTGAYPNSAASATTASVSGGEWVSADGLATLSVSPPATETVAISFLATATAPPQAGGAAEVAAVQALNTYLVSSCLTATSTLETDVKNKFASISANKQIVVTMPLGSTSSCPSLSAFTATPESSIMDQGQSVPNGTTKRGFKVVRNLDNSFKTYTLNGRTIYIYIQYQ
ncbi:MAG: hypothetical protein VKP62_15795 [Candidatus Sericytochromatia bacterium]|nr:hypothetical protein [Candidatus Sericytochromatia bacterium]